MSGKRDEKFLGAFVRFSLTNCPPIHQLIVTDEELRVVRPFRDPVVARRADGIVVRYGRWAFPRRYFFLLTRPAESAVAERAFVPWSGRRLLAALRRHGWPVVEDQRTVRRWSEDP